MATTFTIPLTTLPVGQRVFGPAHPADGETLVTMAIDRTVAGGLNSLTTASFLEVDVQQSNDGGQSWQDLGAWGTPGGVTNYTDKQTGLPATINLSSGTWPLLPGTSRQIRATAIVTGGASIAVAGSIATQ